MKRVLPLCQHLENSPMSEAAKDTIYVDIDDEITGIIDKVSSSKHKIVALVLPKRATVFQSLVNMKLLKRSGDKHKKKLVLITSEASILPLAGAVKLHTAKTLQSKPTIPVAPNEVSNDVELGEVDNYQELAEEDEEQDEEAEDEPVDKTKPIGALAAAGAVAAASKDDDDDVIEIDNKDKEEAPKASKSPPKSKKAKKDDKDKLKIPNFEKFRKRTLLIGGGVVLLLIFLIFAIFVLPKATITIQTDSVSANTSIDFTASTNATELDEETSVVPAEKVEVSKTDTEKVPATGKKNVGEKASGTVSLKLTDCSEIKTVVPAGTTVTSNSLAFTTQRSITFNSVPIVGECKNDIPEALPYTTATVKVIAKEPGTKYNINGGREFAVAGFSNVEGFDSSEMTGGTSKEVTVVSDSDIATAKEKLQDKSKDAALSELTSQLEDKKLLVIDDSLSSSEPTITSSPNVGAEASEVTVTSATTYSLFGVNRDDLNKLVVKEAEKDIDTSKQKISNNGLDEAVFRVLDRPTPDDIKFSVDTTVSTGAQFDEDAIKEEIAGKKSGQVELILEDKPNVKDVQVSFSPFWVYKVPSKVNRVEIVIEQAN